VISAAFIAFCTIVSCACVVNTTGNAYWQILLVRENEEKSVPELVLVKHALQLLPSLDNSVAIIAVNYEDDTLGVLEVMSPQRSDLVLSTDIPNSKLDVLVFHSLDVETLQ
jgi:hypothetical protein